jgi:hypothetical protein
MKTKAHERMPKEKTMIERCDRSSRFAALAWLALPSLLFLAACGAESRSPQVGTNTNWLQRCESSLDCGTGLRCVCNVCSSVCTGQAACASFGDEAVCTTLSASSCDGVDRDVCVAECQRDADCTRITNAMCENGLCVGARTRADAAAPDDTGDTRDAAVGVDAEPDPDVLPARDSCVGGQFYSSAAECRASVASCFRLPSNEVCGVCTQPLDCSRIDCTPYTAPSLPYPACSSFGQGAWEGVCGSVRYRIESTGFIGTMRYWDAATGELLAHVNASDTPSFCGESSFSETWGDLAAPTNCDAVSDDSNRVCN